MLVLVFKMLRYCRISGKVIRRRALKNLRPIHVLWRRNVLFDKRIKNLYKLAESWSKGKIILPHVKQLQSSPVKVDWYKWRRNGEVIHERVKFQHEPEFVRCSNELEIKIKVPTTDHWLFDAFSLPWWKNRPWRRYWMLDLSAGWCYVPRVCRSPQHR